jgi:hypothetical protein
MGYRVWDPPTANKQISSLKFYCCRRTSVPAIFTLAVDRGYYWPLKVLSSEMDPAETRLIR